MLIYSHEEAVSDHSIYGTCCFCALSTWLRAQSSRSCAHKSSSTHYFFKNSSFTYKKEPAVNHFAFTVRTSCFCAQLTRFGAHKSNLRNYLCIMNDLIVSAYESNATRSSLNNYSYEQASEELVLCS